MLIQSFSFQRYILKNFPDEAECLRFTVKPSEGRGAGGTIDKMRLSCMDSCGSWGMGAQCTLCCSLHFYVGLIFFKKEDKQKPQREI